MSTCRGCGEPIEFIVTRKGRHMPPLKTCRYCGKEMPQGTLHAHEHKTCPKIAGVGQLPPISPAPKAQTPTGATKPLTLAKIRPRLKRAKAKALVKGMGVRKTYKLDKEETTHKADGTPWDAHCERAEELAIEFIEQQESGAKPRLEEYQGQLSTDHDRAAFSRVLMAMEALKELSDAMSPDPTFVSHLKNDLLNRLSAKIDAHCCQEGK